MEGKVREINESFDMESRVREMNEHAIKANWAFVGALIFAVAVIFLPILFSVNLAAFDDMFLRMTDKSYFSDDETEDLVVELFTKQDKKQISKTEETKRIIFSTSKYATEKEVNKTVNYALNYISNVGGKVNDISTEKVSNGGLIIFRPKEKIVKTIDIEVPKDALFAESLEETLHEFINTEKYTVERYNKRHNK